MAAADLEDGVEAEGQIRLHRATHRRALRDRRFTYKANPLQRHARATSHLTLTARFTLKAQTGSFRITRITCLKVTSRRSKRPKICQS